MCLAAAPLLFGTAGTAATATAAATAATSGLIGTAGAFSAMTTLGTLGTVLSAAGAIKSGMDQQEGYNAQAQQTLNQAAYSADAAKAQAEKIRRAGRAQVGEAKASLAASGVKLGEGTALEIDKQITQNAEEDAFSALLSGNRTTAAAQEEAKLLGKAGSNAATNSVLGAAGTVAQAGWKAYARENA